MRRAEVPTASQVPRMMGTGRTESNQRFAIGISLLSAAPEQRTGTWRYASELVREFATRPEAIRLELLCNDVSFARAAEWKSGNVVVKRAVGYRSGSSRATRVAAITAGFLHPRRLARQFS